MQYFFSDVLLLCWWCCYLNQYFDYKWSEVKLQNNCTLWRIYSSTTKMIPLLVKWYKIVKRISVAALARVFSLCCCWVFVLFCFVLFFLFCFVLFLFFFLFFFSVAFFTVKVKNYPWSTCSTWIFTLLNCIRRYLYWSYIKSNLKKANFKKIFCS